MHLVLDGAIQKFSLFLSLVQMVTGLEAPFLAPEPRQLSWTNHFCEIARSLQHQYKLGLDSTTLRVEVEK